MDVAKIKDYVEERMQQIDELGDHFLKLDLYDDVRQAEIEGRGNELIKVYEIICKGRIIILNSRIRGIIPSFSVPINCKE